MQITTRKRGAPLDLIVAEAMILANSTWGAWLSACGVPGIYRSQSSLAPGVKVRMGVKPAPHAGMGVAQYTWATSPLRRYVDLVNQWQIVACVRHGRAAALAAPFKPRDATLFSIISSFDATYGAYNEFQQSIERYWTLRWLQQHDVGEIRASTLRDGLVRADDLPLVFKSLGCENLPRGTHVRVAVRSIDTMTLDIHGVMTARLDDSAPATDAVQADDDEVSEPATVHLAIDVAEAPADDGGASVATTPT